MAQDGVSHPKDRGVRGMDLFSPTSQTPEKEKREVLEIKLYINSRMRNLISFQVTDPVGIRKVVLTEDMEALPFSSQTLPYAFLHLTVHLYPL